MPTPMYNSIVSKDPVLTGEKSMAYVIPLEFVDGPVVDCRISIQAAFIRPDWTLVFVDHNVMITFHVMKLRRPVTREDLKPTSEVSLFFILYLQLENLRYIAMAIFVEQSSWA